MSLFANQLDALESYHGRPRPHWPVDPYEFLIWWHCGYPPSDEACDAGWKVLKAAFDLAPAALAKAGKPALVRALKAGGLIPELRAPRIKDVATQTLEKWGGDLARALRGMTVAEGVRALKKFPGMGEPGAQRILLFGAIAPLPAVPSNATQVAVRMQHGSSFGTYAKDYREGRKLIEADVPATVAARQRAFLLLKQHGQTLCKRTNPKCHECPISGTCVYFAASKRSAARKA